VATPSAFEPQYQQIGAPCPPTGESAALGVGAGEEDAVAVAQETDDVPRVAADRRRHRTVYQGWM
jgi:hypothetical protein